jgi:hypothetical protein
MWYLLESEYDPGDERLRATINKIVIDYYSNYLCTSFYVFVQQIILTNSDTRNFE